ncbi:AAA family ATPase [bacterium]|nr:AAA family ATPase [bacterium]
MTAKLAIMGKSGSGKTTIVKAFLKIFKETFPDKSILLFDNDLTSELGHSFGMDIRKTIYGIRSGKHEYKTGIPDNMSKQEYIEWALEDITEPIDENVDIIVSWFVGSKDCRCPITKQLNDALQKLIERYDMVIFDCEFDLKYLNQLVDVDMDTALIVANPTDDSAHLAKRIEEFSAKHVAGGQLGVVLNKVGTKDIYSVIELLRRYELEILGVIPYDQNLTYEKESKIVSDAIKEFYFRLNLPQA